MAKRKKARTPLQILRDKHGLVEVSGHDLKPGDVVVLVVRGAIVRRRVSYEIYREAKVSKVLHKPQTTHISVSYDGRYGCKFDVYGYRLSPYRDEDGPYSVEFYVKKAKV